MLCVICRRQNKPFHVQASLMRPSSYRTTKVKSAHGHISESRWEQKEGAYVQKVRSQETPILTCRRDTIPFLPPCPRNKTFEASFPDWKILFHKRIFWAFLFKKRSGAVCPHAFCSSWGDMTWRLQNGIYLQIYDTDRRHNRTSTSSEAHCFRMDSINFEP